MKRVIKMNQLECKLHAIQTSKVHLKKELENTTDEHIKQKIQHYLDGLDKEEKETLDQLNFRLDDITLTEEEDDNQ